MRLRISRAEPSAGRLSVQGIQADTYRSSCVHRRHVLAQEKAYASRPLDAHPSQLPHQKARQPFLAAGQSAPEQAGRRRMYFFGLCCFGRSFAKENARPRSARAQGRRQKHIGDTANRVLLGFHSRRKIPKIHGNSDTWWVRFLCRIWILYYCCIASDPSLIRPKVRPKQRR